MTTEIIMKTKEARNKFIHLRANDTEKAMAKDLSNFGINLAEEVRILMKNLHNQYIAAQK